MWKLKVLPNAVFAYHCKERNPNHIYRWKPKKEKSVELSQNSSRKMKRAIQWLIACSEFKETWEKRKHALVRWRVNHCCLTFHENLKDDNWARKILSSWLEVAKYRWDVRQYVWKAEPQERGAIHFHLTTNKYMPHEEVRYTWNRALRKHKLANINDNSIDVHAVVEENDMLKYFSDYLTDKEKHDGRRKIKGRLWGSSQDLASAGSEYIAIDDTEILSIENELLAFSLEQEFRKKGKEIPKFLEHVIYWRIEPGKIGGEVSQLFNSQIQSLQNIPKKQLQFWLAE